MISIWFPNFQIAKNKNVRFDYQISITSILTHNQEWFPREASVVVVPALSRTTTSKKKLYTPSSAMFQQKKTYTDDGIQMKSCTNINDLVVPRMSNSVLRHLSFQSWDFPDAFRCVCHSSLASAIVRVRLITQSALFFVEANCLWLQYSHYENFYIAAGVRHDDFSIAFYVSVREQERKTHAFSIIPQVQQIGFLDWLP